MVNRLEISSLPPGRRWPAQLRLRVDGEAVVPDAVGEGGRGPLVHEVLRATGEGRRVVLGEPECTGGCCGYLSVFVRRLGDIVEWSDWEVPEGGVRPPTFHFDAGQYEAEVAWASAPGIRTR
ncbi:hypothetical protein ACWEIK_13465 [Streptomyces sp. NPDC004673]